MTGEALKLIAVVCMLIDHVAWTWVPVDSLAGIVMHLIGRVTMPVMAFMIAEGYIHTHDFKRYAGRILIFAFVSDVPFMAFERSTACHNVMFTLFIGLMVIRAMDSKMKEWQKYVIVGLIGGFASYFDWSFIGVLLCYMFWQFRGCFSGMFHFGFSLGHCVGFSYGYALRSVVAAWCYPVPAAPSGVQRRKRAGE